MYFGTLDMTCFISPVSLFWSFQPRQRRNAKVPIEAIQANRKISLNKIRGTVTDVYLVTVSAIVLKSKLPKWFIY